MPSWDAKMQRSILVMLGLVVSMLLSHYAHAFDNDHDGISDANDKCPNTAQLKKLPANFKYQYAVNPERLEPGVKAFPVNSSGCELDNDGDGIVNSKDYCPDDTPLSLSGGIAANGCPKHSDADGTPDYRDKCPNTPRGIKTDRYGCEVKT
ncbi:MAG: thrombospondin type 3 repeat-containing protein [Gammaproteobacteria bacterium]